LPLMLANTRSRSWSELMRIAPMAHGRCKSPGGRRRVREWDLIASHHWYDFTVVGHQFERRFAGRMETAAPSFSDPAR
jgi:hypothetical protein